VVWSEKVRVFTRGRKKFVKTGMSFGVRGSALTGVGISGPVVVPPKVLSKGEENIK